MNAMSREASARYPLVLLALFSAWWTALAIAPHYRQDWLLENVIVFIALPVLIANYKRLRFSNATYTCLFVFLLLHEIGAHYTYAEVPLPKWLDAGVDSGLTRNHFDRVVHFLYGVLIAPMAIELLDARAPQRGLWRWMVPWLFMVSHGALFEIIEAIAAGVFGGELGEAYLGTQGDPWDSQKDSGLAAAGAAITVTIWRCWHRGGGPRH